MNSSPVESAFWNEASISYAARASQGVDPAFREALGDEGVVGLDEDFPQVGFEVGIARFLKAKTGTRERIPLSKIAFQNTEIREWASTDWDQISPCLPISEPALSG